MRKAKVRGPSRGGRDEDADAGWILERLWTCSRTEDSTLMLVARSQGQSEAASRATTFAGTTSCDQNRVWSFRHREQIANNRVVTLDGVEDQRRFRACYI